MKKRIRWGILSTAKIGRNSVIPAILKSELGEVRAICSRGIERAQEVAKELGIPVAYGSYEELLGDPEIDAIYNPLPNNLHLEWNVKIMEAGKHLLCEKPLGLTVAEVEEMIRVRDRCGVKAGEAFMSKSHPQWADIRKRIHGGELGKVRMLQSAFCYHNTDPDNIRNIPAMGGGGVWDIGCYCITMSRFVFEEEPLRVVASLEKDPKFGTDRLSSVIMDFPSGQSHFGVSTQAALFQRMQIIGDEGHMEVRIPFTPPINQSTHMDQDKGSYLPQDLVRHEYDTVDQYSCMADAFAKAILEDGEVPVSFEDALKNTRVLTAVYRSGESGAWEVVGSG